MSKLSTNVTMSVGQGMELGVDAAQESRHKPMLARLVYTALASYKASGGNVERLLANTLRMLGYRVSLKLADRDKLEDAAPRRKAASALPAPASMQ